MGGPPTRTMYTTCMPGTHRDQKGVLNSLELELQTVVSQHLVAEN